MKKMIRWIIFLILGAFVFMPFPVVSGSTDTPKLIGYTIDQNIRIQLPPTMDVSENPLDDRKQLLYSAYMNDEGQMIRGYIQVWQLEDVEKFLVNSKEVSSYDFYSYTLNKISVGNLNGLLNSWGASFGEHSKISGKEYWLRKSGSTEVLRIAFLTSDANFSADQLKLMSYILASLRWE